MLLCLVRMFAPISKNAGVQPERPQLLVTGHRKSVHVKLASVFYGINKKKHFMRECYLSNSIF